MLVQLIIAALILGGTGYLVSQGILSNITLFASVAFGSILAMGLYETAAPIFAGWRPEYANALAFFGIFIISCGVIRLIFGLAVPDNIPIELWTDRIGAGVIGFFTSMIAIGTTVIAIDMLPLYDAYLGFERYPNGLDAAPAGLWIPADSLVLGLYRMASNGAFGGSSFAAVHPDLTKELYGYRHAFPFTGQLTVSPDLVKVPAAYIYTDPTQTRSAFGTLPTESTHILIVRTMIDHGDAARKSFDPGNPEYLRLAPTQVRLLTSKQNSLYPIGYLEHGIRFIPLDVDKGYTVDDYSDKNNVVTDWVFALGDDDDPRTLEVKQFSRTDLLPLVTTTKPNTFVALKLAEYPPHLWIKDQATIQVVIKENGPDNKPLDAGNVKVWIISAGTPHLNPRDPSDNSVGKMIDEAYGKLDDAKAKRYISIKVVDPKVPISLHNFFTMIADMFPPGDKPETAGRDFERYFKDKIAKMLDARATFTLTTDKSGATPVQSTLPLSNQMVVALLVVQKPSYGFYLWHEGVTVDAKQNIVVTLNDKNLSVKLRAP